MTDITVNTRESSVFPIHWLATIFTLTVMFTSAQQALAEPLRYSFVKLPPFQYQPNRPESEAQGVTIDLLRAAARDIDLALTYQQIPRQRLINAAATGQIQVALVSKMFIAPMQSFYRCSTAPLTRVQPTLYVNQALHPHINSANDLTDELVYVPYSTSSSLLRLLPNTIKHNDSNKDTVVSSLFSKGRTGLVVNFKENMEMLLKRSPPNFSYQAFELIALDILLCINKDIDNYEALHQSLEQALLRVANSEEGQAIYEKHQLYLEFIAPPAESEPLRQD